MKDFEDGAAFLLESEFLALKRRFFRFVENTQNRGLVGIGREAKNGLSHLRVFFFCPVKGTRTTKKAHTRTQRKKNPDSLLLCLNTGQLKFSDRQIMGNGNVNRVGDKCIRGDGRAKVSGGR